MIVNSQPLFLIVCLLVTFSDSVEAFSSFISFDVINDEGNEIYSGHSNDINLKWEIIGPPSSGKTSRVISRFNDKMLKLTCINCTVYDVLKIQYVSDYPSNEIYLMQQMVISFWVYINSSSLQARPQTDIILASGRYWPRSDICWFVYYTLAHEDVIVLKASLVSSLHGSKMSYAFTFLNSRFQFNEWMFMIVKIQPARYSGIQIDVNSIKSDSLRTHGSKMSCPQDNSLSIYIGGPQQEPCSCVQLLVDDLRISEEAVPPRDIEIQKYVKWTTVHLLRPRSPYMANEKLIFILYATKKPVNKLKMLWDVGNGDILEFPQLQLLSEGLESYYESNEISAFLLKDPVFVSTINYTYKTGGKFNSKIAIFDNHGQVETIEFNLTIHSTRDYCIPDIKLEYLELPLEEIIVWEKQRRLLLTSIVIFPAKCSKVLKTEYIWQAFLKNSQDVKQQGVKWQLENFTQTNQSYISVPGCTFPYGVIQFVVHVVITTKEKEIQGKHQGLIKIIPSSVVAVLSGGASRTVPENTDTVIDASLSYNPDDDINHQYLKFDWYCWLNHTEERNGFCKGKHQAVSSNNDNYLKIPGSYLRAGNIYKIRVKVSSSTNDDQLPGYEEQTLYITSLSISSVSIICIQNCAKKVNAFEKIILAAQLLSNQPPSFYNISWQIQFLNRSATFNWEASMCMKRVGRTLCIKPNVFSQGEECLIVLKAYYNKSKSVDLATYHLITNEGPSHGRCSVTPEEGLSLLQTFVIECNNFLDDDMPLLYELYQIGDGESDLQLSETRSGTFRDIILASGQKEKAFICELKVVVYDSNFASTEFKLNLTVFPTSYFFNQSKPMSEFFQRNTIDADGDGSFVISQQRTDSREHFFVILKNLKDEEDQERLDKDARLEVIRDLKRSFTCSFKSIKQSAFALEILLDTSKSELLTETQREAVSLIDILADCLIHESATGNVPQSRQLDLIKALLKPIENLIFTRAKDSWVDYYQDVALPTDYEQRSYFEDYEFASYIISILEDINLEVTLTNKILRVIKKFSTMILKQTLPDEDEIVVKGKSMKLWMAKWTFGTLWGYPLGINRESLKDDLDEFVVLTSNNLLQHNLNNSIIDIEILKSDWNLLSNQPSSREVNSPVISVVLRNGTNGKPIRQLGTTMNIFFPKKEHEHYSIANTLSIKSGNAKELDIEVHKFEISGEGSVIFEIALNDTFPLQIVFSSDRRPILEDFNQSLIVPGPLFQNNTSEKEYISYSTVIPIDGQKLQIGMNYIGILPLTHENSEMMHTAEKKNISYELNVLVAKCVSWSVKNRSWSQRGCQVAPNSTPLLLQCQCSHASLFGSSSLRTFIDLDPFNSIHLILRWFPNPVIPSLLLVMLILYIFILKRVRRYDQKLSHHQSNCIFLEDSNPEHKYLYLVIVSTGFQRNASTTSHVAIQLKGDLGFSEVHLLNHSILPTLLRGHEDKFLLATKESLGRLLEIIIFHDAYGQNPDWYLTSIEVHDIQQHDCWFFNIHRWITFDDKHQLKYHFSPVEPDTISPRRPFGEAFAENMCQNHLLYSIRYRVHTSNFTSTQRLSTFLTCSLLMFTVCLSLYGIPQTNLNSLIERKQYAFSFEQISFGIIASICAFPLTFLLSTLFKKSVSSIIQEQDRKQFLIRKSRKNVNLISKIEKRQNPCETIKIFRGENMYISFKIRPKKGVQSGDNGHNSQQEDSKTNNRKNPTSGRGFKSRIKFKCPKFLNDARLQCWSYYTAWFLLIVSGSVSAYILVIHGMYCGMMKSFAWLISISIGLVFYIFFLEPFLIISQTVIHCVITMYFRHEEYRPGEIVDKDNLLADSTGDHDTCRKHQSRFYRHITNAEYEILQHNFKVEKQSKTRCLEIIGFCVFYACLWAIVYQVRSPIAYHETVSTQNMFVYDMYGLENYVDLNQVNEIDQIYNYLDITFLSNMHGSKWQDEDGEHGIDTLADKTHILLGVARLRQLRVATDYYCKVPNMFTSVIEKCAYYYNSRTEDRKTYFTGWTMPNSSLQNSSAPWKFKDVYPYLIGSVRGYLGNYPTDSGYIAELGMNRVTSQMVLNYLDSHDWIDYYTRVVLCEATLYNVNSNYFSAVTILFEVSPFGRVISDYSIWVFRPIGYVQNLTSSIIIPSIILIVIVLIAFTMEFVKMYHQRINYFLDPWHYLKLTLLTLCSLLFVFYYVYYKYVRFLIWEIHTAAKNSFFHFSPAVFWDKMCIYTFAVLICLSMFKLWKLLTFNRHMYSFVFTLRYSFIPLIDFTFMFFILLTAFTCWGHLIFGSQEDNFQTFYSTLIHFTIFAASGRVHLTPYFKTHQMTGGILFLMFSFLVKFYLMNMFVSIIMSSFKIVRIKMISMKSQYDILPFIKRKLKYFSKCRDSDLKRQTKWLQIEKQIDYIFYLTELLETKFNSSLNS